MKKGLRHTSSGNLAFAIVEKAFQKGLRLLAPVGFGGATLKVCPPLTITREGILDGLSALAESGEQAADKLGRH